MPAGQQDGSTYEVLLGDGAARSAPQLLRAVAALAGPEHPTLRVDVRALHDGPVSPLWLATLVASSRRARRAGSRLVVVAPPPALARALHRAGLDLEIDTAARARR